MKDNTRSMNWLESGRIRDPAGGGLGSGDGIPADLYLSTSPSRCSRIAIRSPPASRKTINPAATTTTTNQARYPAVAPVGLPTAELKKVTIDDLFAEGDKGFSQRLFKILYTDGFFYLDLNSKGRGEDYLKNANELHDAAKHVFDDVSAAEKDTYVGNPFKGEVDKGYRALNKDEEGRLNVTEILNGPIDDLLNNPTYQLPSWLSQDQHSYNSFAQHSNEISQALLRHLDTPLGLAPDSLASMHRISATSGGFVRMLHYPAPEANAPSLADVTSPPNTDSSSVNILFNWQGGLQVARPKKSLAPKIAANKEGEDWLWVKPLPGFAIVNIGDPMVVFTNGVLKSGLHRVVKPLEEQAGSHRYSVLAGFRPKGETKMRALESEVISRGEKKNGDSEYAETADEWAVRKVTDLLKRRKNGG